jgi:hypothetical protein
MSAKPLSFAVLLGLLAAGTAAAQPPNQPMPLEPSPPMTGTPVPNTAAPGSAGTVLQNGFTPLPGTSASRWVEESSALPVGGNGPIGQEIYFETGPTLPIGNGVFGLYTHTGWMVNGGGRALFFNPENSAALTAKIGLTFQENLGIVNAPTYKFFTIDVRTRSLVRTSGEIAIGRDLFRQGMAPIGNGQDTFRFGADAGFRWGTEELRMDVINDPIQHTVFRHRSNEFGGIVLGLHADIEVPFASFVWFTGLRFEYGYDWSRILPGQNSNMHDVNLLISTGFRY